MIKGSELKLRIKFMDGSLEYYLSGDILVVKALNNTLEFRPRAIIIDRIRDYFEGGSAKYKYIYVDLLEPIKPLPFQPTIKTSNIGRFMIGNYELRYTNTPIGEYHTVITPGTHLYEYAILTVDRLGVKTSRKREIYFDQTDYSLTLYFV